MLATSHSLLERLHDPADHEAWRRLTSVYEPWLRGWLSRHRLQPADVEDVLQDILVAVNARIGEFVHNGQAGAFRAWLRTILTFRVRHFLRGQRNQRALQGHDADWLDQLEDADSALSREWDLEHDRHLVRGVLAGLRLEFNATTWGVFQMLVLEDHPAAEVAEHFGITANAVYVAKSRVLSRLRAELRGLTNT
jgi:RNA polymerase sigma factor (sigma-70 family)